MIYKYPENDSTMIIEFHREKFRGNWVMVYYKNVATGCNTVKEIKARFGSAKFTESCKKVCAWVEEQFSLYDKSDSVETEVGRADTSFASEALSEEDPNYQTKMVT